MSRARSAPEINASSMADIAFLLLIFFLVTTTIDTDSGITVKLPPWSDIPPETQKLKTRNVYSVMVNANDDLLVRGEEMDVKELRENTKIFITNPERLENMSESPKNAIVSLRNDRGTSYESYILVYNELKAAYNEIWEEESQKRFGVPYKGIDNDRKKVLRGDIPFVISEAEPTDFSK